MTEISNKLIYLLNKYDRAVPRYTSFPTAVQFHKGFGAEDVRSQLMALDHHQPISVYIHIPYCHSLCHYCGCHTKIVHTHAPITAYITSLIKEIALVADLVSKKIPISRIHFGGGSPNYAPLADLEKIFASLHHYFTIDKHTELHMECDPRLLNTERINAYANLGITRISLGVQDFNLEVQQAVNRIQPYELVAQHFNDITKAGIDACNFDLIIGLPKQTLQTVKETALQVLQLRPSRIAVFPYAHVPWMKKHQKVLEQFTFPDTITRFAMSQLLAELFTQAGYASIGIDHFALPEDMLLQAQQKGRLRRNFQGYTDDQAETLLGFGLSAISQFSNAFAQNTLDASAYRQILEKEMLPVAKGCYLSEDDQLRRDLITEIMCCFEVTFADFSGIIPPYDKLTPLLEDGLIELSVEKLRVTEIGKPFTRVIASCFDPYFQEQAERHSRAV